MSRIGIARALRRTGPVLEKSGRDRSTRSTEFRAIGAVLLYKARWKRTKEMKQRSDELESIPGIGPGIAQKLRLIGVNKVSDFRNTDPERLYNTLEQTIGAHVDRCVLYVFRSAVYFSNHQRHDPEKLKWWNWKD